jgi:F0F1-type ATP synthase assembly protein I
MVRSKTAPAPAEIEGISNRARSNRAIFVIAALDMSWRLAIAVLVPIIGGFELDKHLGTTPALTILGFLLAMAGLFFILKRSLAMADEKYKRRSQR